VLEFKERLDVLRAGALVEGAITMALRQRPVASADIPRIRSSSTDRSDSKSLSPGTARTHRLSGRTFIV
jgi:hypothetical protein